MNDCIKATGLVRLYEGDVLLEEIGNLVVQDGLDHVASRMVGTAQNPMSHIAIGTGSTPPTRGDHALASELARKAAGASASGSVHTLIATFNAGEGTGAITEAGLFNAGAGGVMMSRVVFSVRNKTSDKPLTIVWTITYN